MPIIKKNGDAGLLADAKFGDYVEQRFPLIELGEIKSTRLLNALFRDYSYASAAYLLEPCHHSYLKTHDYGLARPRLPRQLAVPLTQVAERLGGYPLLEYTIAYTGTNWKKRDPNKGLDADNIDCIRLFEGSDDERGFVAVHLAMI